MLYSFVLNFHLLEELMDLMKIILILSQSTSHQYLLPTHSIIKLKFQQYLL